MSEELKNKLKAARAHTGLTQRQFAERLRIPLRTLQAWEADRFTPRGFALKALEEKLDAILAGE